MQKSGALAALVFGVFVGCGDDPVAPPSSRPSSGTFTGRPDSDDDSGRRTLSSCTTSIGAGVPSFYERYFKCVTVEKTGDGVTIATEDLPPHRSNYWGSDDPNFEEFDTSRGPKYKPNPNLLEKKSITIKIPDEPVEKPGLIVNAALVDGEVQSSTEEYPLGPAGVALDSVALFNPLARPGDDIENEKYTFDAYDAHPAPDGTYHYHRSSRGPRDVMKAAGASAVELIGIMCDGTVVLGCTELDGSRPPERLDAQGGHVTDLVDEKGTVHFTERYHTHVCETGRKFTPEVQYYRTCGR